VSTWITQFSWVRLIIIALVGTLLGVGIYSYQTWSLKKYEVAEPVRLKAAGTSSVYMIMENNWRREYREFTRKKINADIDVDYASIGTSKGIEEMVDKRVPVAFTHAPMSAEERSKAREKGGDVVHVPIVVCAVVPVFNLPELLPVLEGRNGQKAKQLIFSGEILADIYRGKISKWNDERLKKLQDPEVASLLPDRIIYVVHREDSSGTTLIFTEFLSQASKEWAKEVGGATSKLDWPVGVPMARNTGVADCVRKTKGAIGYVDLVQAWHDDLPGGTLQYGAVLNRQDKPLHADAQNMTAAIEQALPRLTDDPSFQLTYQEGENSYPIVGLIWAVCYQNQPEADRKMVADFLEWITHDGQKVAGRMAYAPLPAKLVSRAEQKIQALTAH
jgi:phosphate ABC transporter phosphate-binding protein